MDLFVVRPPSGVEREAHADNHDDILCVPVLTIMVLINQCFTTIFRFYCSTSTIEVSLENETNEKRLFLLLLFCVLDRQTIDAAVSIDRERKSSTTVDSSNHN
jgi:hypothetical protein